MLYKKVSVTHHRRKIKVKRRKAGIVPPQFVKPRKADRKRRKIRITPSDSRTITDPRMAAAPKRGKRRNELEMLF